MHIQRETEIQRDRKYQEEFMKGILKIPNQ